MRHNHPAARHCWVEPRQLRHDGFIRQAMKTVTPHASIMQRARQGKTLVHIGLFGVEGGIKTGDLRHTREGGHGGTHPRQAIGLVQGRQRHELLQCLQHRVVDADRLHEAHTPVHDAMAHRHNARATDPRQHLLQRLRVGLWVGLRITRCPRIGSRMLVDSRHLPGELRHGQVTVAFEQRILERRRTGVENEQVRRRVAWQIVVGVLMGDFCLLNGQK